MAWPAPVSRSSGGRSAVHTISGTRAWRASSTAGWKLAAAVPDVHSTTAGRPDALAAPRAKNAADRSSRKTSTPHPGVGGQGQGQGRRAGARAPPRRRSTPARAHSSTRVRAIPAWASPSRGHVIIGRTVGPTAGRGRAGARLHPDGRVVGRGGGAARRTGSRWCGSTCPATGCRPASGALRGGGRRHRRRSAARPPTSATPWAAGCACAWPSTGPTWCSRLVLLGGSPGIADRRRSGPPGAPPTTRLADDVERVGTEAFLEAWLRPADVRVADPVRRRPGGPPGQPRRRPGLRPAPARAPAPRSRCGTAWASSTMPVLVVAGEHDAKFAAHRPADGDGHRRQRHVVAVAGAGHAAHLERPGGLRPDRWSGFLHAADP